MYSKVVPAPMGIAVCAESLYAALKGRDALNVKWDKGTHPQLDNDFIEKSLIGDLDKPGAKVIENGDAKKALGEAKKKVEATYFVPFVAHATMEPMNCTAYVRDGQCDVWAPTQGQLVAQARRFASIRCTAGKGPDSYHFSWMRAWQARCPRFCGGGGYRFKGTWKTREGCLDEGRGYKV